MTIQDDKNYIGYESFFSYETFDEHEDGTLCFENCTLLMNLGNLKAGAKVQQIEVDSGENNLMILDQTNDRMLYHGVMFYDNSGVIGITDAYVAEIDE